MARRPAGGSVRARLTPTTQLFVVLTLAEAAAVVRLRAREQDAAARNGLAKIRTALTHLTADYPFLPPAGPAPSHPQKRAAAPRVDDYVPWRDEANGVYE